MTCFRDDSSYFASTLLHFKDPSNITIQLSHMYRDAEYESLRLSSFKTDTDLAHVGTSLFPTSTPPRLLSLPSDSRCFTGVRRRSRCLRRG